MRKILGLILLLWACFSTILNAGKLHVISIEENAQPVLNSTLRTQHPIDSLIVFDNLDDRLYETQKDSKKLKYNPSFDKVKDAIEKLKSIAKGDKTKTYIDRPKVEKDALLHLFLAATNLLTGEYGMPWDREYGIEIMKWYLQEAYLGYVESFGAQIKKLEEDIHYPVDSFIEEIKNIKKERLSMYSPYTLGLSIRGN